MKAYVLPALGGVAVLLLPGCQDASKLPAPAFTSVALVRATIDPAYASYDLRRARASVNQLATLANPTRPVFRFTLDLYSQRDLPVRKVYVYKTLRRGANPASYTYGPRTLAAEVSTFPTTLSFDSQQVLTDMQSFVSSPSGSELTIRPLLASDDATGNSVYITDAVLFTYEYETEQNGQTQRVVLTPTIPVSVVAPSAQTVDVVTGSQIAAPYAVVAPFTL